MLKSISQNARSVSQTGMLHLRVIYFIVIIDTWYLLVVSRNYEEWEPCMLFRIYSPIPHNVFSIFILDYHVLVIKSSIKMINNELQHVHTLLYPGSFINNA